MLGVLFALAACSGGRDKLLADLQSSRPEDRALAVKKLAAQKKADDLSLFTQAARDPAAIVRAEAVTALGDSNDSRVVDILGELLTDDDNDVQLRAAKALAQVGSEKAKEYLMMQYGRRNKATRQAIVQALTEKNVPGAMASVVAAEAKAIWERNLETLQRGTLAERIGAAEELGKSGRPEAVNRLVPLLKDSQVMLVAAAVRGLVHAGDRRAVGPISQLLSESYPELREAACVALTEFKDGTALNQLVAVANEKSPASPLAVTAIMSLEPTPESNRALCEVMSGARPPEAMAAGKEMRRRGGCLLEPIVEKLKSSSTQMAALVALQSLGPLAAEAQPKVVTLLTNSDPAIRTRALEVLAELGDKSAAPLVLKAYEAELKVLEPLRADWISGPLSASAPGQTDGGVEAGHGDWEGTRLKQADLFKRVQQLNEARAKESQRLLLTAFPPKELVDDVSDDQLRILAAALRALGKLQAEGALEILSPYREESNASLRAAAFAGLASLGPVGVKAARAGLLDADRSVQTATGVALAESEVGQSLLLEMLPQLTGDRSHLFEALKTAKLTHAAVPVLLQLIKEGDSDAGSAALMIGRIKAPDAVDALLKALKNETLIARREVLLALGMLGDARALEGVSRDLYNDRPDIRAAAAEATVKLGGGDHADSLLALKVDYYRKVREAAAAVK